MSHEKRVGLCDCNINLSRKECLILVAVGSVALASGICTSLQAPIYPQVAEKKGANASEYGLVFGIFELVNFILCPIYGKYMNYLGAKCLMIAGMFVAGVSYILFGFLDRINSHMWFIALSFVLRIIEAVGISASFTASYTIVATAFTRNVSTMLAFTECLFGFGFTLGPTIGGYFYQIGGFQFPFIIVGTVLLVDGVFILFTLPDTGSDNSKNKPQGKISSVLKLGTVTVNLVSIAVMNMSLGYYLATLEPHLRQFNLTPVNVGLIFGIEALVYVLTTPLVGILCDHRVSAKKLTILGFLMCITSFSLVGPLPFAPISGALWMVYLGMVLQGLGMSCITVPCFIDAIRSAIRGGLADDVTTYSLVTGLATSAVALGAFIGPSVAGFLSDHVGFRNGTLFVITTFVILLFVMMVFVCTEDIHEHKAFEPHALNEIHTGSSDVAAQIVTESARVTTNGIQYGTNAGGDVVKREP